MDCEQVQSETTAVKNAGATRGAPLVSCGSGDTALKLSEIEERPKQFSSTLVESDKATNKMIKVESVEENIAKELKHSSEMQEEMENVRVDKKILEDLEMEANVVQQEKRVESTNYPKLSESPSEKSITATNQRDEIIIKTKSEIEKPTSSKEEETSGSNIEGEEHRTCSQDNKGKKEERMSEDSTASDVINKNMITVPLNEENGAKAAPQVKSSFEMSAGESTIANDEANDSQESMSLVIDEKPDEHEPMDEDEPDNVTKVISEDSANKTELFNKENESKDDEKDSCEDTSEMSVVTQIGVGETIGEVLEKSEENSDVKDIIEKSTREIVTSKLDTNESVIEIDDDVEEISKDSNLNAKIENDKNSDVKEKTKEEDDGVIEIIDEDDEDNDANEIAKKSADTARPMEVDEDIPKKQLEKKEAKVDGIEISKEAVPAKMDTAHEETDKNTTEEPETEDILLKQTAARPVSPAPDSNDEIQEDTTDKIFYQRECINYECPRNHKQYFLTPQFALSYFKVAKKKFKAQFICAECYDKALDMYEEFSGLLNAKQPLLLRNIFVGRPEFVEIIDSSDEEDDSNKTLTEKVDGSFSNADLKVIEDELHNSIQKVLENVDIQNQLTWSKTLLETRARKLEEESNLIDAELRTLQAKADHMHESLYQCPKIKLRQLQPLDLNSGRAYGAAEAEYGQLPPVGEIQRPPILINETYYAVKNKAIASWVPCKIIEQVEGTMGTQKNLKHYKVKFLKSQYTMLKTVSAKHLAYYDPPPVRLPIGTRVIAYFDATTLSRGKEKMSITSAFYPGVIAEPLKPNNKYRYLIFYDDGYTQYVNHKDVRLVCNVSENVWEDVHQGSREFIQKYLTQYSINRPMVQTQKGQSMSTESYGKWIYARVVDIDCSLIQMQFEGGKNHTEWIYRGSMRLGPVFKEYQKSLQKDTMPVSRLPRRTEPFIRYTEDEEAANSQQSRAVAKKSVSRQESTTSLNSVTPQPVVPTVRHLNNSTIYLEDENKPKGKVVYYTAKRNMPPLQYRKHICASSCLFKITHNLATYSPLSKPLLSGWERMVFRQKIKKVVAYRGPCGKIMRNMRELRNYLRITENTLNVDNFDFSPETNCLAEYVIESVIVQKRDISNGQEKMALPLVNYYDNTMPPECQYAAQRIPTEGVNLNLDEEFLCGCDCEDDCADKSKCACWQLTYAGAKFGNPNTPLEEIGYQYKRLYEHVPTGIYECNSRCKCKKNCLNRVVQESLQMKLQVFKTSNRGWGLRCINDVPRGSFICIYAGHLLTEAKANEGGLDAGDEYFAELDYIEVAEQIKEGYESDVEPPEIDEEEDNYAPEQDDDDEFTPSKTSGLRTRSKTQKLTKQSQNSEEDSQERQVINFNPNADMNENSMRESSIRQLFGKDEACYIMDAKTIGNLGRYFNHSCSPNLFVQNVFVDTHDLRFPWVAFFSSTHIRAGTELTWNYNYEVGVVPGKVLYCQCGAPNCRLRLL